MKLQVLVVMRTSETFCIEIWVFHEFAAVFSAKLCSLARSMREEKTNFKRKQAALVYVYIQQISLIPMYFSC